MFGLGDFFSKTHPIAIGVGLAIAGIGVAVGLGMDALGLLDLSEQFGPSPFLGLAGWAVLVATAAGYVVGGWLGGGRADREEPGPSEDVAPVQTRDGPAKPDLSPTGPEQEVETTFRDRVGSSVSANGASRSRGR